MTSYDRLRQATGESADADVPGYGVTLYVLDFSTTEAPGERANLSSRHQYQFIVLASAHLRLGPNSSIVMFPRPAMSSTRPISWFQRKTPYLDP